MFGKGSHSVLHVSREAAICYEALSTNGVLGSPPLQVRFCEQPLPPSLPSARCVPVPAGTLHTRKCCFLQAFEDDHMGCF